MIKPQTVKHNHVVKSYNQPLILVTTAANLMVASTNIPKAYYNQNFESSELQVN